MGNEPTVLLDGLYESNQHENFTNKLRIKPTNLIASWWTVVIIWWLYIIQQQVGVSSHRIIGHQNILLHPVLSCASEESQKRIDRVVSTIQQTLQSILGQPTMTVLEPVGDLKWNKQLGHTAKLRGIGRVCARSTDSTVHGKTGPGLMISGIQQSCATNKHRCWTNLYFIVLDDIVCVG